MMDSQDSVDEDNSDAKLVQKMPRRGRRMWSKAEMGVLTRALAEHGTSVRAIAKDLGNTRTQKQVLQKLINMKKWPNGCDPKIIKIINKGRLSIKT